MCRKHPARSWIWPDPLRRRNLGWYWPEEILVTEGKGTPAREGKGAERYRMSVKRRKWRHSPRVAVVARSRRGEEEKREGGGVGCDARGWRSREGGSRHRGLVWVGGQMRSLGSSAFSNYFESERIQRRRIFWIHVSLYARQRRCQLSNHVTRNKRSVFMSSTRVYKGDACYKTRPPLILVKEDVKNKTTSLIIDETLVLNPRLP